ncbi:hypothetical protein QBC35DRAFT_528991 [Podospora australis]|uniref:Uncharacterized protein n=1 Tax=Podospora australis TaxID=1536484 RepID=A0AAN7ANA5_9PEZI|nr:hypothetical protein QBC35DRAFT_528991 [Podospora australis]
MVPDLLRSVSWEATILPSWKLGMEVHPQQDLGNDGWVDLEILLCMASEYSAAPIPPTSPSRILVRCQRIPHQTSSTPHPNHPSCRSLGKVFPAPQEGRGLVVEKTGVSSMSGRGQKHGRIATASFPMSSHQYPRSNMGDGVPNPYLTQALPANQTELHDQLPTSLPTPPCTNAKAGYENPRGVLLSRGLEPRPPVSEFPKGLSSNPLRRPLGHGTSSTLEGVVVGKLGKVSYMNLVYIKNIFLNIFLSGMTENEQNQHRKTQKPKKSLHQ